MSNDSSAHVRNQSVSSSSDESKGQQGISAIAFQVDRIGRAAVPYSLVAVLFYIGALKFLPYEAEGISGLVSNSPFMAWTYSLFSIRGLSAVIGITKPNE